MRKESNSEKDSTFGLKHTVAWRVKSVESLEHHAIKVIFIDGLEGIVEFRPSFFTGVFEALKDPKYFKQVSLLHGAVSWPGGQDIAPDAMHTEIQKNGKWVLS